MAAPDFDKWMEENESQLWITYHETGACYDCDYERWLEKRYEKLFGDLGPRPVSKEPTPDDYSLEEDENFGDA